MDSDDMMNPYAHMRREDVVSGFSVLGKMTKRILSGKIKAQIKMDQPNMKNVHNSTKHVGHQIGKPNRKKK